MKKMTLFLLTALVLASVFAGCSASAYMDDPYAGDYSNVSTTRNGTVNGTNGRYTGYGYYDGNTAYNGTYNGTYSAYPNAGTTRSTTRQNWHSSRNRLLHRHHLRHRHDRRQIKCAAADVLICRCFPMQSTEAGEPRCP